MRPVITLLTDFGWADTFVAQMKGVLLGYSTEFQLVDVTHQVPHQDVRCGSRMLAEYVPCFPAGSTHVAVVDPGVGTSRKVIVVRLASQTIVLPDNGLITDLWNWAFERNGAAKPEVWQVSNPALWRRNVSSTFHGRDLIAPVAAYLAGGGDIGQVGPAMDKVELLQPLPEATRLPDGSWQVGVETADHFGNVSLSVAHGLMDLIRGRLAQADACSRPTVLLSVATSTTAHPSAQFPCCVVGTYGQCTPGQTVLLLDSQGRLELAVVNGSAVVRYGLGIGSKLILRFAE